MGEIDRDVLANIQAIATQMAADFASRDDMADEYEEAFHLTWIDKAKTDPKLSGKMVMASADGRVSVLGAARLMYATDPQFKVLTVDADGEEQDDDDLAAKIDRQWQLSSRLLGEPLQYPLITSGLLYGEIHASVTPMAEILARLTKKAESGDKYAAKRIALVESQADKIAFRIDPWNPNGGYYEHSNGILERYYKVLETTVGRLRGEYILPAEMEKLASNTTVNLHLYWDLCYHAAWCDQGELYLGENDYPCVPVVVQVVDGSTLFDAPEQRIQPLLYGLVKSKLLQGENLSLTTMTENVFSKLVNNKLIHTSRGAEGAFVPDYDADVWELNDGESLAQLQLSVIDPQLQQYYQLVQAKGEQSTIYGQALGAPVAGDSTFSELSLLSQSGRLPLIGAQRRGGWGIGGVAELMLDLIRHDPAYGNAAGIKAGDIPPGTRVEVKLDVKLPQDKLQQANIARMITQGDNPIASVRWARENILNIGDSDAMDKEILDERADILAAQSGLPQLVQQLMGLAQGQMGAPTGGEQMPPPGEQPMQQGPMMAEGQEQAVEGMPPQMAGMMPGAGGLAGGEQ